MYLPYLDYFRSVAKYESMTQAASHLHISQPALSQTIMKLEDELGVQLFHRKKGKLSLTSAGKLYYSDRLNMKAALPMEGEPLFMLL